nr:hypothetical protein [uncultured Flavobacterium sp.]
MDLQQKYTELLLKIGFPTATIQTHWSDLEKAYSKKARHYHNLNHLREMIACFDNYNAQLQHPNEVLYAIFYHDYIYNSTKKDNELKSAEFSVKILPKEANLDAQLVFDMILATKDHQPNGNEDGKWLIDFDLKILAKDWKDYKTYFGQIRKEYSIYPDFLYNPGRKKALEHFLEHKFIFQTEEFRTQYETKARENIKREIELL